MVTKSTAAGGAHVPPAPGPHVDAAVDRQALAANLPTARLDVTGFILENRNAAARNVSERSEATVTREVSSNGAGATPAAEAGGAAGRLLQATGELANRAGLLRKEVEDFPAAARAA